MPRARIAARVQEARDVVSFVLEAVEGPALPVFEPGAHVDVEVGHGLVRPYSLCPPSHAPDLYRIAIQREAQGRGGSRAAHESLDVGRVVDVGAPRNLFPLADPAAPSLLFAGGIGITPLLAMAAELHRRGAPFQLHYSAPSADRAAFVRELASAPFARSVHLHFSNGEGEGRLDIHEALSRADRSTHLYLCGSRRYADAVVSQALSLGWSEACLHQESFTPLSPAGGDDAEFEVATSSGVVVVVRQGQTIVEALAAQGIAVPTSCEQGICGTCLTGVLQGTPDHRDSYLTEEERAANRQMLPCCSRALTPRLVLDL